MSFEREINLAVQLMFKHAKAVVSRNLTNAVRQGKITIDETRVPGLELIINRSIDAGYQQSAKQLTEVIKNHEKNKK